MASAVLGSVGLHCVLHASCPVTVVRPTGVGEAVAVEPIFVARGIPVP